MGALRLDAWAPGLGTLRRYERRWLRGDVVGGLTVGALLITFAWTRDLNGWDLIPAIAIMLREIFVSGLREYLGNRSISVPVTFLAKWKTTVQLVALGLIIAAPMLLGLGFISHVFLWIAGGLTVWTGWEYLRSTWPHLSGPEL